MIVQESVNNYIYLKTILKYMICHINWIFQKLHFYGVDSMQIKLFHFLDYCLLKCVFTPKTFMLQILTNSLLHLQTNPCITIKNVCV